MYEELIKRLREDAEDGYLIYIRVGDDVAKAADAIEELSKFKEECDGCGDKARSAIEKLQKMMPHWIPVTERLPKHGERVLVFGGFTMYVAYYDKNRYGGESWHKLNSKSHYCNPTYWMPLPTPPKGET